MGHVSINELLTDLRKAAEECRLTEDVCELLTSFFQFLPTPAWIKVVQADGDLVMVRVNREYERQCGITAEQYRAQQDNRVWAPGHADPMHLNDLRVVASQKVLEIEETTTDPQSGELRVWRVVKWPVVRVIAVCGVAQAKDEVHV